jgi:hypothetical protein
MADLAAKIMLVGVARVLRVIGFKLAVERNNTVEASLEQFEDFRYLVEKDIRDMADEFLGKRTEVAGRIGFGLGSVMHWVQDCLRASDVPNQQHFDEVTLFEALTLAQTCMSDVELISTNTKAADPGKFKDKRKWPEWEKAFINYLSVVPGVTGIPLLYVVQEENVPTQGLSIRHLRL